MLFGNKKIFSAGANCSALSDTFQMSGGSLFHWFGSDTNRVDRICQCWPARHDQVAVVSIAKSRSM